MCPRSIHRSPVPPTLTPTLSHQHGAAARREHRLRRPPTDDAGGLRVSLTADVIAQRRSIKLIRAAGIGVDQIDVEPATAAGIAVCNVPDVVTEEVAEQACTLRLAVNRELVYCQQMAASGRWSQ